MKNKYEKSDIASYANNVTFYDWRKKSSRNRSRKYFTWHKKHFKVKQDNSHLLLSSVEHIRKSKVI